MDSLNSITLLTPSNLGGIQRDTKEIFHPPLRFSDQLESFSEKFVLSSEAVSLENDVPATQSDFGEYSKDDTIPENLLFQPTSSAKTEHHYLPAPYLKDSVPESDSKQLGAMNLEALSAPLEKKHAPIPSDSVAISVARTTADNANFARASPNAIDRTSSTIMLPPKALSTDSTDEYMVHSPTQQFNLHRVSNEVTLTKNVGEPLARQPISWSLDDQSLALAEFSGSDGTGPSVRSDMSSTIEGKKLSKLIQKSAVEESSANTPSPSNTTQNSSRQLQSFNLLNQSSRSSSLSSSIEKNPSDTETRVLTTIQQFSAPSKNKSLATQDEPFASVQDTAKSEKPSRGDLVKAQLNKLIVSDSNAQFEVTDFPKPSLGDPNRLDVIGGTDSIADYPSKLTEPLDANKYANQQSSLPSGDNYTSSLLTFRADKNPVSLLSTQDIEPAIVEFSRVPQTIPLAGDQVPPSNSQAYSDLARKVAQQLTLAASGPSDQPIEISLSPEELGRVRLTFSPSENGMAVSIITERPETLDLIRKNINSLAHEFLGIGYENVSFDFSQSNLQQNQGGQSQSNHASQIAFEGHADEPPSHQTVAIELTPTDRIDIRI